MTMIRIREVAVESMLVAFSAGFLAWYIVAKVAAWPWGAYTF